MGQKKQLLIIGFVWPEPSSSAAGHRMMQLISLFRSYNWEIIFASAATKSAHTEDLERHGIRCVPIKMNSSSFDEFVGDLQPEAVLFDRFITEEQFGWRVEQYSPESLRINDTEDLHALRRVRKECIREEMPFTNKKLLNSETAKREIASILRSDLSLIISEFELQLLSELFGIPNSLIFYLPLFADPVTDQVTSAWPDFEERSHFMTIGNFNHPPNADSVKYLRSRIWPVIRKKLPDAEMHVYGAYPGQQARQCHNPDIGFHIRGRVDDAAEAMRTSRVCLAPLRFGAGLKGKLLEAMQHGTPSVTTSVGAEGINGDYPWSGRIADDQEALVTAAIELYQDKSMWEKAQQKGINIINNRFRKKLFENTFQNRLQDVLSNIEEHRLQNFTGAMLRHHRMASTEYMSRWIEAKNRNREES